ncbi:hypothetical protein B0A55_06963 [Friedmanniomyces simplex]|uniref:Peroxisomal membrane protein PEX13 n=1 Tax=Friedmanniomyces simplex TaxID=329884 RepID=A0A4U0X9X3_9PEZI|nr:hypothetical protein B0A55_06963 [Friedmanniomyces simplex]
MFDGTALTSPTLYISYDTLYASNSCHGIGRTIKNTIVPVASNHLSSLAYQPLANWAIGPGQWGNGELSYKYISRPFNLTDLVEPIPDSIFNQLPFCQRELRGWKSAGFNESGFTCSPRDAPYAPLIAIPTEVRDLDPAWASCTAWYGGLFDPPVALQGVAAAATPTVPAAVQTTPASARSTLSAGFPAETGGAYQPATSFQNADPTGTPILTSESMPTAGAAPHGSQTGEFVASTSMIEAGLDPATVQLSNSASFTDSNAELSSTTAADPAGSVAPGVAGVVASIIGASKGIDDDTSATNLAESASRSQTTTNALSVLLAAATTTLAASELPVVVLPSPAVQVTGYDPEPSGSSSSVTYTVPIPNPTPDVTGSQIPASMVFEADGQTYTAYQPTFNTGGIEIAESTTTVVLESGSHMSAGTQTLSNIGGGSFVAGQTTLAFPSTTGEADPPESTSSGIIYPALSTGFIGGLTLTGQPYPSGLILENTATSITLSAQGPAVMIGTDSVGAAGFGAMVLDGSTYQVVPSATSSSSERAGLAFQSAKALTVAGQIFTAVSIAGGVELLHGTASATLVADGSVAAIGTAVVSVDVDGQLEVASSTPTLPQVDQGLQLLTLGSAVVTATPVAGRPDVAEIGGYTLSVGGPARIISGQLVSEGIGGLVSEYQLRHSLCHYHNLRFKASYRGAGERIRDKVKPQPGEVDEVVGLSGLGRRKWARTRRQSPPKPWETGAGGTSVPTAMNPTTTATPASTTSTAAPTLPQMPDSLNALATRNASAYSSPLNRTSPYSSPYGSSFGGGYGSSFNSPYSRMGGGMYGGGMYGGMSGMSGMGGYGGMGMGYGQQQGMYGAPQDQSLTQTMNQSTQATFQMIESIVGAFGGFAQMLESTYMATHSSFFAMVSVADQFATLKQTLGSVLGIFTLMRWIRTAIAKITGRPPPASSVDLTPANFAAFNGGAAPEGAGAQPKPSRKPFIFFIVAVFGLPYLMSKLIRTLAASQEAEQQKQLANAPYSADGSQQPLDPSKLDFCRVLYDYTPQQQPGQHFAEGIDITVKKGDLVAVLSKTDPMGQPSEWWRCRARDGQVGYLPSPYLEVIQRKQAAQAQIAMAAKSQASSSTHSRVNTMTGSATSGGSRANSMVIAEKEKVRAAPKGAPPKVEGKPGDVSVESFQRAAFSS